MDSSPLSPPRGFCHYYCCSCFPVARDRIRILSSGDKTQDETIRPCKWWSLAIDSLMKAREWSEMVAGPRWKNFIRRFNRKGSGISGKRFGYDPLSYSLNFDGGVGSPERDYLGFSTRFVSMPGSEKSVIVVVDEGK